MIDRSGWKRLGLVLSGVWAALVVLMALASSDPGQNYVARVLMVPIIVLWCLGYAVDWVSRVRRPGDVSLPLSSPDGSGARASAASLRAQQAALWWAAVFVCITAIVGAFTLQSAPDGSDVARQLTRIAASTFAIAILAIVIYIWIRPRTSMARARFLLATAFVGAAFVLWQALDDTQRVRLPPALAASEPAKSTASRDNRAADRSETSAKTRRQVAVPKAAAQSTPPAAADWPTALSGALRRHNQDYLALASKWDTDVDELRFESMLTPATLTSSEGRRRNRERLMRFEALLAGYLAQLEALQRDYRADVLATDIPAPQRENFLEEFEGAFAASAAETQELNAEFERVELEIVKTILSITDLTEREENAVTVGTDGKSLLFERDAAASEYDALLNMLKKTTADEDAVMGKSSEAYRRRADSLNAAADLR